MKLSLSIFLLLTTYNHLVVSAVADTDTSPFFYQDYEKSFHSEHAKQGKMIQKGRTGVAAMHAVLLK